MTLCMGVCETRAKQRISSPTKGAVSACLVLNLWPCMNRNLLSKLNCLCVIIATLVSGGVMSISVFPLASVLVSTSTSTTPLRSSQLQVFISGQYTLARRISLGYLDLSALNTAACMHVHKTRKEGMKDKILGIM